MSMLMSSKPNARARSTSQRVCTTDWWRRIASWTGSAKSCTPMLSDVKPSCREGLELRGGGRARIELDRAPRAGLHREVAVDGADQGPQRRGSEEVRRAATERDLGDRRGERPAGEHGHLGRELVDVADAARRSRVGMTLQPQYAAQLRAERDVQVQRHRRGRAADRVQLPAHPVERDRSELRGRGVARVTRATAGVLGQAGRRVLGASLHVIPLIKLRARLAPEFRARPARRPERCAQARSACSSIWRIRWHAACSGQGPWRHGPSKPGQFPSTSSCGPRCSWA